MGTESLIKTIEKHLTVLCRDIGARPTGSPNNLKAAEYIAGELEKNNILTSLQHFDCLHWEGKDIQLRLGNTEVQAVISDYSYSCDVTAPYICLGTVAELEEADLSQKIAVLYGELTKEALMPKSFPFWNSEEHKQIIALLEEKQPLAIITVSFEGLTPVIEDGDFALPVAVASASSEKLLLNGTDRNISLKIESERQEVIGANVIGNIGNPHKKIVISAHFDTKPNTAGALDNASGVAVLLALSGLPEKEKGEYGYEFVFFNGEDYYSNAGEVTYLRHFLKNQNNYLYAVNIDGAGLKDSSTALSMLEIPDKGITFINDLLRQQYPNVEIIEPWYQGDHSIFALNGTPAVAITSKEIFAIIDKIIHTPADNLSTINLEKLAEATLLIRDVITGMKI